MNYCFKTNCISDKIIFRFNASNERYYIKIRIDIHHSESVHMDKFSLPKAYSYKDVTKIKSK
jgi:hypothetical protein